MQNTRYMHVQTLALCSKGFFTLLVSRVCSQGFCGSLQMVFPSQASFRESGREQGSTTLRLKPGI